MADWDANSPELHRNLQELGQRIAADAAARQPLSSATIKAWQALIMRGLEPTEGEPIGAYRGEAGLEDYDVEVGGLPGAPAERVAAALAVFDGILAAQLDEMDRTVRREHLHEDATGDTVTAVIILCAWAHGEWLRIHPFPNGNGRTARILVNSIALRYGLPAFMRVRPRPELDPVSWTSIQRGIRWPEWNQARRGDGHGDSSRKNSKRGPCGWSSMKVGRSRRWPASWT